MTSTPACPWERSGGPGPSRQRRMASVAPAVTVAPANVASTNASRSAAGVISLTTFHEISVPAVNPSSPTTTAQ